MQAYTPCPSSSPSVVSVLQTQTCAFLACLQASVTLSGLLPNCCSSLLANLLLLCCQCLAVLLFASSPAGFHRSTYCCRPCQCNRKVGQKQAGKWASRRQFCVTHLTFTWLLGPRITQPHHYFTLSKESAPGSLFSFMWGSSWGLSGAFRSVRWMKGEVSKANMLH